MFRQVYAGNNRRLSSSSSSTSSSDDEQGGQQNRTKSSQAEQYQGRRRNSPPPPPLAPIPAFEAAASISDGTRISQGIPKQVVPQQAHRLQHGQDMPFPLAATPAQKGVVNPDNFLQQLQPPVKEHHLQQQPPSPTSPHAPRVHRSHRGHEHSSILRTAFSAFCLFAATIGYCFLGGLMFSYLEQSNEMAECIQLRYLYQKARNATAFNLYDIASSPDMGDEDKMDAFLPILDTLRSSIQNISWDGRNCETMQMKWSLVSASFFSFTVVSTIGYGHIAPRTNWGRLVCIAYATVGLPLMLLTLAKLGAVFAHYFRALYFKILCCGICIQKRRNQARRRMSMLKRQLFQWKTDHKKSHADNAVVEEISSDEEENNNTSLGANIPLLLSLSVAGSSVFVGILIYVSLEKWTVSDSAYFSFISLATIGFGDLVPGYTPLTGAVDNFKQIITAAYIFWGMAVLSMALQMMQDEVIEKFRWLATTTRQICCRKKASVGNTSHTMQQDASHGSKNNMSSNGNSYASGMDTVNSGGYFYTNSGPQKQILLAQQPVVPTKTMALQLEHQSPLKNSPVQQRTAWMGAFDAKQQLSPKLPGNDSTRY